MPFVEDEGACVQQLSAKNWKLLREVKYSDDGEPFVAHVGMCTDFASVPRMFVWFLPTYGAYTKPAILHDHLWRDRASSRAKNPIRLLEADRIFRQSMSELGVPFLQRWIMWMAVRWAALFTKPGGRKDWWRELPRMVLFFLIALPFVLPPAVVVVAALLAFALFELVLWVPLRLFAALQKAVTRRPAKKPVNLPRIGWKTA